MFKTKRDPSREKNGRFAHQVAPESSADLNESVGRFTSAGLIVDQIVAHRRHSDGVYVPGVEAESVREGLRSLYPSVEDETFEEHFQLISEAAEETSRAEWDEDRDSAQLWGSALYRRLAALDDVANP